MTFAKVLYLMQSGASLTQAVDYVAVEDVGLPAAAWADARDVTQRAVDKNVQETIESVDAIDDSDVDDGQEVLA
jgi:hypothetical protein